MALFEGYERRIDQINAVLNSYGISSIEEAEKITKDAGLDVYDQVKKIQPICFENACWAYTVGAAIAIKKGCTRAADAAAAIGEGLQAFCIPGSVADHRKVGLGHGNLGKMLLEEETECFCFLAGHESFAAAEGAIGIAEKANKVRQKPLRVILNGLGRTLHPDNMAAGPASYGMTDTMGRMHSDAQFAGSSSVPAHVEMMGLIGMGNNPMVGATVAVAVSVEEAHKAGKF